MARTIRETFRQYLPGGGRDVLGNPKQGKTRVVASINVTSYAGGGGEDLSAADLSLSTIDSITLRCYDEVTGAGAAGSFMDVRYADTPGQFYLLNIDDVGLTTHIAAGATEVVQCVAEGDSAYDVELH